MRPDSATALQPGQQRETLSENKTNKQKNLICKNMIILDFVLQSSRVDQKWMADLLLFLGIQGGCQTVIIIFHYGLESF